MNNSGINVNKIREIRKTLGMTQEQLADKIGVKRSVISKYETGLVSPTLEQLERIADAFQVPIINLFDFSVESKTLLKELERLKDKDAQASARRWIEDEIKGRPTDLFWDKMDAIERIIMEHFSNVTDQQLQFFVLNGFRYLNRRGRVEAVFKMQDLLENVRFMDPNYIDYLLSDSTTPDLNLDYDTTIKEAESEIAHTQQKEVTTND